MRSWLLAVLTLVELSTIPAIAAEAQRAPSGFRFGPPMGGISVRAGYMTADAKSDVFDFSVEQLILSKRNFGGKSIEADLSITLLDGFDIVLGIGASRSRTRSEFRDWVDLDDKPIEQETVFWRLPMTATAKFYLGQRGRTIGNFVWIPKRLVLFAGAGVGFLPYEFRQQGDFVDFQTLEVFSDEFVSRGSPPLVQMIGGLEYALGTRMALTTQGRYAWASSAMGSDWSGFNDIDLSGISITAGVKVSY